MDNLPEDQQRNDSPPSSPEPEGAVAAAPGIVGEVLVAQVGYPDHQEVVQEAFENLNIQQPPEVEQNVLPNQQQQPLLLRHASVSSLDESSQKYRERPGLTSSFGISNENRPAYRNTSHPQRAFVQLNCMREEGILTDVALVASGHEVKAHKSVLAACSPYFCAMFTGFDEKNKSKITLQDVDPHALEILVNYVYTSEVDVTEDNVQTLLPAANLMQLSDVKEACCEFLLNQLHPTNCLGIKSFADLHGCLELLTATNIYIESHFSEVLDCDEFYALDHSQVYDLIASDTITVPSEEKVYESVISWTKHDMENRGTHLPMLMEHVRLPLLSKDYLLKKVDSEGLFKAHPECKDFIIEALKFHLANGLTTIGSQTSHPTSLIDAPVTHNDLTSVFASPRTRPRQPIGLPKVMLAIGGQAPKAVRSVECYSFKEDRWTHLSDMPVRRCRCGVAVVQGRVYAVGGFNGSLRVRTVDFYDPLRDAWSSAPNMEARRSTLGVAVLNDCIYAVGGFDGSTGLNSAEVLDLSVASPMMQYVAGYLEGPHLQSDPNRRRREWRPIANMSTRRSSVGVGVLGSLIYAVGGYDGNSRQCLASVEVYIPEQDAWKRVADMSARRSGAAVGVLNGLLYSVGGHDGPLVRKSVECYNPDRDEWTNVSEMNYCRRNAGVVTHNGLLYVIGGDDGSSNLQSVEAYSPKTDSWTVLPASMSLGRSYTGVCVIDKPESI